VEKKIEGEEPRQKIVLKNDKEVIVGGGAQKKTPSYKKNTKESRRGLTERSCQKAPNFPIHLGRVDKGDWVSPS